MFLSLALSEYRIQHGAIGPLYVTSSYSTWRCCRGVSGFATDCPCDVWCRGLTTCLLHIGPPFGNRFLNTSWVVGLTYWIVHLHFFVFWHMQLYMSWYIISFFGFIFTFKYSLFFSSTPVLTSSIDVVFVLSISKRGPRGQASCLNNCSHQILYQGSAWLALYEVFRRWRVGSHHKVSECGKCTPHFLTSSCANNAGWRCSVCIRTNLDEYRM